MSKIKLPIWGREVVLNVQYDCCVGEEVTENQNLTLEKFVSAKDKFLNTEQIFAKYCLDTEEKNIDISKMYKYVVPTTLYICRDEKVRKVALICDYIFDEEMGIAFEFKNEKCTKIIYPENVF